MPTGHPGYKPLKEKILHYLAYYSFNDEARKIRSVRFVKDPYIRCRLQRKGEVTTLHVDRDLVACEPFMTLEIGRILHEAAFGSIYRKHYAAIAAMASLLIEAEKFLSLQQQEKKSVLAYLGRGHRDDLLKRVFSAAEVKSTYGIIDELIDGIKRSRDPRYKKLSDDVKSAAAERVNIKKSIIELLLYLQFGVDDPLDEYTQKKWLYHKEQLKAILSKKFSTITPITVDIVPSLECVQNCRVCSNIDWRTNVGGAGWVNKRPEERMMTKEDMFRIIDNIRKGGAKAVVFTGGGEPLTNPNTVDGIVYARKSGLEVGLYTNGILFTDEIIRTLIKSKLTFIRISLNAGSPGVHARIGGYGIAKRYYENVIASLRLLAEENRKSGNRCTIGLGYIVNPWNVDDIFPLAEQLKSIDRAPKTSGGIAYFVIRPSVVHRNYRKGRQFDKRIFEKAHNIIRKKVMPLLRDTHIRTIEIRSRFLAVHSHEKPFDKCLASPMFSLVGPDGGMYLCVESYYGHKRCRFGNLTRQRLDKIFTSREHARVVGAIDFKYCPPVCKMHELNKIFDRLSKVDKETMRYIKGWFAIQSNTRNPPQHVNFL